MGQMCAAHGIANTSNNHHKTFKIIWTSHGASYLIFLTVLSEIKHVFLNKSERDQTQ